MTDRSEADHLHGSIADLRRQVEPIDEDHVLRQARAKRDAHRRRRRGLQGAGLLAAAIVVIGVVMAGLSGHQPTTDVHVGHESRRTFGVPGKWVAIPEAPIEPRRNAMSVWTGTEVLVFGGASKSASTQVICPYQPYGTTLPCGKHLPASELPRSAAAYDRGTNSWRRIAPLPAGFAILRFAASNPAQVSCMLGGDLYVLAWDARAPDVRRHLLRYDPTTDTWASLGQIEPKTNYGWALTSYDHKLIAYPEYAGTKAVVARAFDPATGRWSDLNLPIGRKGDGSSVYASPLQMIGTKSGLFLFSLSMVSDASNGHEGATADVVTPSGPGASHIESRIARFDGRTWKQFTVPGSDWPQQGPWLRTGDHFTLLSTHVDPSTLEAIPTDVIFDPSTNTFHKRGRLPMITPPGRPDIPANIHDRPVVVSTGTSTARVSSTMLAVLDPSLDQWTTYLGPSKIVLDGFATTLAGDQVFFWGGHFVEPNLPTARMSDQGWIWTPQTEATGTSA